jgi:hypothetical protein
MGQPGEHGRFDAHRIVGEEQGVGVEVERDGRIAQLLAG